MGERNAGAALTLSAARVELQRLQDAVKDVSSLLEEPSEADLVAFWRAIEELRAARHSSEALLRDVQEFADRSLDALDLTMGPLRPVSGMFVVNDDTPIARSTKA